jgi:hypothetical protein
MEGIDRIRELLRQHRFLLIRRLDRLSEEEKEVIDELLTSMTDLKKYRIS